MRRTAIILVLLLAACSSSGSSKAATPNTGPPASAITAPPTTVPTATTQQVASIIAQYRGQILGEGVKLANCKALETVQDTDDPLNVLTAKLDCQSGVLDTSTPSLLLARALGSTRPPAEVAALTQQTRVAAQTISRLGTAYSNCLMAAKANGEILACVVNPEWDFALDTLTTKLAGWDAYL